MSPFRIPDDDSLFRHSIYPVSFKGKAFAPHKMWHIVIAPDGSLIGSLVWEKYAPESEYIHAHGCRLAHRRNTALQAAGKNLARNKQVYCGAYHLKARLVRNLKLDPLSGVLAADVVHNVEEGEIAHTDLRIL